MTPRVHPKWPVIALILFCTLVGVGTACDCIGDPPASALMTAADVVFVGRVVETSLHGRWVIKGKDRPADCDVMITWEGTDVAYCHNGVVLATVEVDRSWKGDVTERVEISTPSSGGACGVDLRVGGEYLIYGKRVSGTAVLSTEVCDGSRHVAYAKQHLAALGKPMRNLVLERQNSLKKSK